jgi:hypothetical protein
MPETAQLHNQYRLLILDGHDSHIHITFQWLCKQNQVEPLYPRAVLHISYSLLIEYFCS